jgi:hypothetical protein
MVAPVHPPAAAACSCAQLPPLISFEGTAETESPEGGISERDYEFEVENVISGEVRSAETVRVFISRPGGSSCGSSPRLVPKGRYRVAAYVSALEGKRLLFVGGCGGSAELIAAPPGVKTSSTEQMVIPPTQASPALSAPDDTPIRWPIVVRILAAIGIAGVVLRRSGRA